MLPPGKYYIGDPGLAAREAVWNLIAKQLIGGEGGEVQVNGVPLFVHQTAFGDGIYEAGGIYYSVDSGTLGALPHDLCDEKLLKELLSGDAPDGRLVEFTEPFKCKCEKGVFTLGHIVIDTNDEDA